MTALEEQIAVARRQIVSDGYDMSVGELISLYKSGELIISPSYQRLFRWTESQKTRFIESLLLGIPIPPIFVFQKTDGIWELIDGLQRTSTVLEFVGVCVMPKTNPYPRHVLRELLIFRLSLACAGLRTASQATTPLQPHNNLR